MAFLSFRDPHSPVLFQSWDQYLRDRSQEANPLLCHVLNNFYEPLRQEKANAITSKLNRAKEDRDDAAKQAKATTRYDTEIAGHEEALKRNRFRGGFPWVAPILGSGCLSAGNDSSGRKIEHAPSRMAAALMKDGQYLPDGTTPQDRVRDFAVALVNDHDPHPPDGPANADANPSSEDKHDPGEPTNDDELAARSALAALLLTQFYHLNVAHSGHQTPRLPEEPVFLNAPPQAVLETRTVVLTPLVAALGDLRRLIDENQRNGKGEGQFVPAVIEDIQASLQPPDNHPYVRLSQVTLLTEITWYYITRGTGAYPGWTELLVAMSVKTAGLDRTARQPYITELSQPLHWIKEDLMVTTADSWRARCAAGPGNASERSHLYDTVAAILQAQCTLIRAENGDPFATNPDEDEGPNKRRVRSHLPPAAAFVTSFDLELEMALAAATIPFVMVVPFRVSADDRSSYVWLGARVDPAATESMEDRLDLIRNPRDWRPLEDDSFTADPDLTLPVVVRLTGSPLVTPPEIALERDREGTQWKNLFQSAFGYNGDTTVTNAVLLDEYTAINHAATEFSRADSLASQRLPGQLISSKSNRGANSDTVPFWLGLGVQLADVAVRYRVAAQIWTASTTESLNEGKSARPFRSGAMVNRRSRPTDRDLLNWQSFDVVQSEYGPVVEDLEHYLDHLRHPKTPRLARGHCHLKP